ncbi:hypothetical protein DFH09DRAFT_1414896 [Mycena vulgaris]|nr:hypothetical protein DFH09DRAFT_1414896 [Mycena vulgaris]
MNMVQGLTAVYTRNATTPSLRAYVEAYLSVQFNAVADLATSGGTNIYGDWNCPPTGFTAENQTRAISALISAVTLGNDTVSSTTSPSLSPSPSPAPPSSHPSPKLGPILGGVLGGVVLLVVSFAIWFICRRRSRAGHPREAAPPMTLGLDLDTIPANTSAIEAFGTESKSLPFTDSASGVRYRENSGKHQDSPFSPSLSSTEWAMHRATMSAAGPSDGHLSHARERQAPDISLPHPAALPTEELVRFLNERLQNRSGWDEGETPPEYITGHGSHAH